MRLLADHCNLYNAALEERREAWRMRKVRPYCRFDQVRFVAGDGAKWTPAEARLRRDFHHKTARALVESCDLIALEKLNTAGMCRRPAPKPDPVQPVRYLPNGAAAKSGLN